VSEYAELFACAEKAGFAGPINLFAEIIARAMDPRAAGRTAAELEEQTRDGMRDLGRQLLQATFDLAAAREERLAEPPVGADGKPRTRMEPRHRRNLTTTLGEVTVSRMAYRAPGSPNLHPADVRFNLPAGLFSHPLAYLVAREAIRGSYEEGVRAVERATGVLVGKRQFADLAEAAARDVLGYYGRVTPGAADGRRLLMLQFDGKGVVMRPEALREATARAAAKTNRHLKGRLSPGEKSNYKRMAEIASVSDVEPFQRGVDDIFPLERRPAAPKPRRRRAAGQDPAGQEAPRAPRTSGRWLKASLVDDIATVVAAGFDEAERRDPHHARTWIVLVDGNNTQLDAVKAEARRRSVTVRIVVDLIHVLEYLWTAAWSFFHKGDADAEAWVVEQARAVLAGGATDVATGIRERADYNGYDTAERKGADRAADYLDAKAPYLIYGHALAMGWPIATGIIEGAARHLVRDRMGLTGARWGLDGGEAILLLRAVVTTGDFDDYWDYHLEQEQQRNHHSKYAYALAA
jgi:hypothetical protein